MDAGRVRGKSAAVTPRKQEGGVSQEGTRYNVTPDRCQGGGRPQSRDFCLSNKQSPVTFLRAAVGASAESTCEGTWGFLRPQEPPEGRSQKAHLRISHSHCFVDLFARGHFVLCRLFVSLGC